MEIDKMIEEFDEFTSCVIELITAALKMVKTICNEAINLLHNVIDILDINKRVKYLAFHHRKNRVKKKNMNRLIKLLKRRVLCGCA